MGIFISCCKGDIDETEKLSPTLEVRRQLQAEAAERRQQEQQNRGIKDPEKVRRQQQRADEMEKREEELSRMGGETALKWTAN